MPALWSLSRIAQPPLSSRRGRQEVKQQNTKSPSPCVLDAVSIEPITLVRKVELGFPVQIGKVEFRGIERRIKGLSVKDAGT